MISGSFTSIPLFDYFKSYWVRSIVFSVYNWSIQFFSACNILMLIFFNYEVVAEIFGKIFLFLVIYKSAVLYCCVYIFDSLCRLPALHVGFWNLGFLLFCFVYFNDFNSLIFVLSPDLTSVSEMRIKDSATVTQSKTLPGYRTHALRETILFLFSKIDPVLVFVLLSW